MPKTALKHLAKRAKTDIQRVEYLWNKAAAIVKKEYNVDENDGKFWALRMGITKRMLGLSESLSFKNFLNERADDRTKLPKYDSIEIDRVIEILNTHCKDALWMITENKPIYRGMHDESDILRHTGFSIVNTSATVRGSQNASNYYTVILDNHPDRKQFPKRSRSFIGTTESDSTNGYGDLFCIIPFDDVPIGIVNHRDIWDTQISMFGRTFSIVGWNDLFESAGIQDTIESIKKFDSDLKAGNSSALRRFEKYFSANPKKYSNIFLETIWDAYSAKATGHTVATTATMKHDLFNTEVWVGGKVVVIYHKVWDKLLDEWRK